MQAAVVWDNGPANPYGGYNSTETVLADDFVLTEQATIRSAAIWAGDKLFGKGIEYAFYSGGEAPGALIAAGMNTVAYTRDSSYDGMYMVSFDLGSPVTLDEGNYWFSIRERNATPFLSVAVYMTDRVTGRVPHQRFLGEASWFNSGGPPSYDVAFRLYDAQVVPEPRSACLVLTAGLAFAVASRRRRAM
jgi:hypothetical protein